jgi:protein-tyrosine phosphatase
MEFDRILPNLYVGSYPDTPEDIDQLRATGITAVLNVQSDDDGEHLGIDWSLLRAHYFGAGIEVRRVRIQDFDDADLREHLPEAVAELDDLLQGGRTALVHCSAGINRSPSVVICYLHWVQGWALETAEGHVRRYRACDPVMEVIRQATLDQRRP